MSSSVDQFLYMLHWFHHRSSLGQFMDLHCTTVIIAVVSLRPIAPLLALLRTLMGSYFFPRHFHLASNVQPFISLRCLIFIRSWPHDLPLRHACLCSLYCHDIGLLSCDAFLYRSPLALQMVVAAIIIDLYCFTFIYSFWALFGDLLVMLLAL
jgi:hypothetical protein